MIKNVIFDIGQVLVEFNWRKYLAEWFPDEETARHVAEATVQNRLWLEVDRGALPLEEVIDACVRQDPAYEKEIRIFFERKSVIARELPYAEGWLLELKRRGYKVYLLSNYSGHAFEQLPQRSHFLDQADGMIISYRVRLVKPEPAIYERLLSDYGLVPEECVFLDDLQVNLDAAAKFGMKTILFTGYEQGRAELEALLQKSYED